MRLLERNFITLILEILTRMIPTFLLLINYFDKYVLLSCHVPATLSGPGATAKSKASINPSFVGSGEWREKDSKL